jgi:uncharacterized SAM-binding protein YcdF (DUF218 family)
MLTDHTNVVQPNSATHQIDPEASVRRRNDTRSVWAKRLRLIALAVALDLVVTWFVWNAAHLHMQRPEELPAGAPMVVFFTPERRDLDDRVRTAAEVYGRHGRRLVICVGGSRPHRDFFGSEAMAAELEKLGVAAADLLTERQSFDTAGNASASLKLSSGSETLVLVTDVLHLFRIQRSKNSLFPSTTIVSFPTPRSAWAATAWWRVHYEIVAYGSELVPDAWRLALLRTMRP